jgi:hypothetical protein
MVHDLAGPGLFEPFGSRAVGFDLRHTKNSFVIALVSANQKKPKQMARATSSPPTPPDGYQYDSGGQRITCAASLGEPKGSRS